MSLAMAQGSALQHFCFSQQPLPLSQQPAFGAQHFFAAGAQHFDGLGQHFLATGAQHFAGLGQHFFATGAQHFDGFVGQQPLDVGQHALGASQRNSQQGGFLSEIFRWYVCTVGQHGFVMVGLQL
ncbi:MAG: hypothetical protein ACE5KM_07460 [Planctomycetaceae bacterium]